jgi:hypothetical protein
MGLGHPYRGIGRTSVSVGFAEIPFIVLEVNMGTSPKIPTKAFIDPFEPIPVADVEELDWAAWEDSVAFQDSRIVDDEVAEKSPHTPKVDHPVDAFSAVTKNSS